MILNFSNIRTYILLLLIVGCIMPVLAEAATVKNIPSSSLLNYWKFDEGAGTLLGDSVFKSPKVNGAFVTAPSWVSGKINLALKFDSSGSQYARLVPVPYKDISVSAWVKPASTQSSDAGVWGNIVNSAFSGNGLSLKQNGSNTNQYGYYWCDGVDFANCGSGGYFNLPSNIWSHVIIVRDQTNFQISVYVNGILNSQNSYSGDGVSAGAQNFNVGNYKSSPSGGYFNGIVDELAIYNRVITAAEAKQIYMYGAPTVKSVVAGKSGLVGYWPMDEGTGTQAGDMSGNKSNGTLYSSPIWSSGKIGKSLLFDGANTHVDVPYKPIWDFGTGSFSISAWFRNIGSGTGNIIRYDDMLFYGLWGLQTGSTNVNFLIANSSRTVAVVTAYNISSGNWHHVVGVRNSSTGLLYIYIDGILAATPVSDGGLNVTGTNTYPVIGSACCSGAGGFERFKGNIDEVRIYNRALSPSEVQALYFAGAPTIKSAVAGKSGLVGYWPMEEGTGTQAGDMSGNRNNGTLFNSPSWVTGRIGKAILFNGSTNYVTTPSRVINGTGNFTISTWVKYNRLSSTYEVPVWNGIDSTTAGFGIGYRKPNSRVIYAGWGSSNGEVTGPTSVDGVWYHLVSTYNGSSHSFYVNGVLQGSPASFSTSNFNSGVTTFGNLTSGASYPFSGNIDEVRIYNRALSASEVQDLYKVGR